MDESNVQITEPGAEPVEQSSETAPTGNGEKLLPQSQVNALIAQARREGAASAAKKAAPVAQPAPQPVAPANGTDALAQMAAELQEMKMRGAFDRAAMKAGIDDSAADDLFDLYRAQRPADPHAWIGEKVQRFGLGRKPELALTPKAATESQPPAQPAAAQPPPTTNISDKGRAASSDARDPLAILQHRPTESTLDDFDRLVTEHGRAKALEMWVANTRSYLRNVRVTPGRR